MKLGMEFLTDFWKEKYLQEYIKNGGSKIKFVTGRRQSGKTYFLKIMSELARQERYKVVQFSAKEIWMHDFKEIYAEIFRQCKIMECLEGASRRLIHEMGFAYEDIPPGMKFMDFLSQNGMGDVLTRREIRFQLRKIFLDNPLLDNNFALACSMLTGSILGYPTLEEQNRDMLLGWLEGDRSIKLSQLRALDFYPSRITKYNARHMLRSLAELVHMGGYSGLFIAIDDLEILISRSSLELLHYTKMKREDTYESIRQLIDDIDSMKNLIFGERIGQANDLFRQLSAQYPERVGRYHSQMGPQANRNTLERFRSGELRILIACKSMDEGIDVPDASVGIILSGTSAQRQRIQRLGRIIRRQEGKKRALLYYLHLDGTSEESFFLPEHGETRSFDLKFCSADQSFFHPAYETAAETYMRRLWCKGADSKQLQEARQCLQAGYVRPDWLLDQKEAEQRVREATSVHNRNYWICMKNLSASADRTRQ